MPRNSAIINFDAKAIPYLTKRGLRDTNYFKNAIL